MSSAPLVTVKETERKALKRQEAKYMREHRTYVRMAIAFHTRWPDEDDAAALEYVVAEPAQKKAKAKKAATKPTAAADDDDTPVVCNGVPGSGQPCELAPGERKRAAATKHTDGALHATCRACKREYKKLYPPVPRPSGEKK